MTYIEKIFKRANIQQIREFLLNDASDSHINNLTYEERIAAADDEMLQFYTEKFPDATAEELNNFTTIMWTYKSVAENVYTEIGMQCGAYIISQLFENFHKEQQ